MPDPIPAAVRRDMRRGLDAQIIRAVIDYGETANYLGMSPRDSLAEVTSVLMVALINIHMKAYPTASLDQIKDLLIGDLQAGVEAIKKRG